jgi:predicted RNA-binding Zn ribbon-like protein
VPFVAYAGLVVLGIGIGHYVTSNSYEKDITKLKADHAEALETTKNAQIAECDKAKGIGEDIDHESNNIRSSTDAAYIADLKRLLSKCRADAATYKTAVSSARLGDAETEVGLTAACPTPESIAELGYEGQYNGEIAAALQLWVCKNMPETRGCEVTQVQP